MSIRTQYTKQFPGGPVAVAKYADEYATEHTLIGPLLAVAEYARQIFDEYPTAGYGTRLRLTGADVEGQTVTVVVWHGNSCE